MKTLGNTGLGKQSILELVKHNPKHIYLAARTPSKAEAAIADIKAATPDSRVSYLQLDLMSFDSIKTAAEKFNKEEERLDILMNNAGKNGTLCMPELNNLLMKCHRNHGNTSFQNRRRI
jgi:NAD(P)-dependent dehydrogenase (short-subunit alcohol dehydrogenase family)